MKNKNIVKIQKIITDFFTTQDEIFLIFKKEIGANTRDEENKISELKEKCLHMVGDVLSATSGLGMPIINYKNSNKLDTSISYFQGSGHFDVLIALFNATPAFKEIQEKIRYLSADNFQESQETVTKFIVKPIDIYNEVDSSFNRIKKLLYESNTNFWSEESADKIIADLSQGGIVVGNINKIMPELGALLTTDGKIDLLIDSEPHYQWIKMFLQKLRNILQAKLDQKKPMQLQYTQKLCDTEDKGSNALTRTQESSEKKSDEQNPTSEEIDAPMIEVLPLISDARLDALIDRADNLIAHAYDGGIFLVQAKQIYVSIKNELVRIPNHPKQSFVDNKILEISDLWEKLYGSSVLVQSVETSSQSEISDLGSVSPQSAKIDPRYIDQKSGMRIDFLDFRGDF